MMWLRKSKKGFTLIELMVVVAIIAVLSLLGLRVYTAQATKAKNASVQANIHSLSTELGVLILDETNPAYNATTVETAATNAQITNPFDTTKKGADVVDPAASAAGYIKYEDTGSAYKLTGFKNDLTTIITEVNYQE